MCCGITLDGSLNVTAKTLVSSIEYAYNSKGLLSKKTVAVGSTQAIYYTEYPENASPVVKVTVNGKTIECHSKTDSFGRKVFDELRLGTGFVSRQFSYHAGKATEEHKKNGKLKSSPTTNLVSRIVLSDGGTLSYAYDAEERITSVTETYVIDEATVTNTTAYTYDEMGRLLTETVNGTAVNTMTYDAYGNILTKNGVNYVYDNVWKDLLTSYNGQSITYDAQGNPTNYLGHTLTWEKGRQLKSFDNNTYTYNANGIRTSKTVNGIKHSFALDGSKILREEWCGNTLIPLYDNADSVCGIMYNGQHYFFLKNLQGDVIAITDSNGNTVARYSYDAWGACTVTQDSSNRSIATVNPYRYRGYYFDSETGLYYLQSRYYDPNVGRFINADSPEYISIQGGNLFDYCGNCPTKNADYFGFCYTPTYPESTSGSKKTFVVRRWMIATIADIVFSIIPVIKTIYAPIETLTKSIGKSFFKENWKRTFLRFFENFKSVVIDFAAFLKRHLGGLKWFKSKFLNYTSREIAQEIFGWMFSQVVMNFLDELFENFDIISSLGGLISGAIDWFVDGKIDDRLWVITY